MHRPRRLATGLAVALCASFACWLGWNVYVVRERKAVLAEVERNKGDAHFGYIGLEQTESSQAGRAACSSRASQGTSAFPLFGGCWEMNRAWRCGCPRCLSQN